MNPRLTSAIADARTQLLRAPFIDGPRDEAKAMLYLDGLLESSRRLARSTIDQPVFVRTIGPIERSGERFMKAGLDNPDNDYWQAEVRSDSVYVIEGHRGTTVDLNLQLLDGNYAEHTDRLATSLGTLPLTDLVIDNDGSWRVTLGGEPVSGNHIPLPPSASTIFVRETWADWASEQRGTMSIRKVAGPDQPPGGESLDDTTARFLTARVNLWLQFGRGVEATVMAAAALQSFEPNVLFGPMQTQSGMDDQHSASGRFDIGPDEALVVTLNRSDATYFGIQLGDDFFTSLDYVDRPTCLNHAQATADRDGAMRLVIAHRDPGIANWLDTTGRPAGYVFCRWHGLTPDTPPLAPTIEPMATDEVVTHLAEVSTLIGEEERAAQLRARRAGFAARRAALPDCD